MTDTQSLNRRCFVNGCGPSDTGNVMVLLQDQDGAFGNRWFHANSAGKQDILAVGVAATVSGLPVEAHLSGLDEYSTVNTLYIRR